ncbi:MAG: hypothetical protein QMD65_01940 [Patescibacteria group bacterium]|nr:hypothetical protein [Patescibacteria group bacterium]
MKKAACKKCKREFDMLNDFRSICENCERCNCSYEELKRYWGTERGIIHNRSCPMFKKMNRKDHKPYKKREINKDLCETIKCKTCGKSFMERKKRKRIYCGEACYYQKAEFK